MSGVAITVQHMSGDTLPTVILQTTASVDGRVTLGSNQRLLEPPVARRWATIDVPLAHADRASIVGATATLEGSGSFVDRDAPSQGTEPAPSSSALSQDYLPTPRPQWFVVADGRGRVPWTFTGDDTTALHVLACRATPREYLERLRDLRVGYFVVGDRRVDLRLGLARIRSVLGAQVVLANAGGTLNAALLRAGLVDVVDVVTLPGLVGGTGTPSIMDGPALRPEEDPIRLELIDCVVENGCVRTRYRPIGANPRATPNAVVAE